MNTTSIGVAIASIILIGYLLIFLSSLLTSNQIKRLENELAVSSTQLHLAKSELVNKDSQLKEFKTKLRYEPTDIHPKPSSPIILSLQHPASSAVRPGVIILGMHRSGTSLAGGLINKMGLKTGGPLIGPAEDNAKGFFERIDVVLQNDYIMKKQGIHYAFATYRYDALTGLKDVLNDDGSFFKEGHRGLKFLNNPDNYPWMLKDPRLCITFRTWLPLLNFIPAILFTYRHPLDVAMSMHKREFERFEVQRGLKMWYVYNRRAVQQSNDLCRIVTSHRLVMQQPRIEFDRIYSELKSCGVEVPHQLTDEEIKDFIDIKLQHGQSTLKDKVCESDLSTLHPPESWQTTDPKHLTLYREVMRVYCALENRSAFEKSFVWDETIKDG
jgi:hypothetical protein